MSETLFSIVEWEAKSEPSPVKGTPRLVVPNRTQMELRPVDLESLLPADHAARAVWEFVESLDLSPLYAKVQAVEGVQGGRPSIRGFTWRCGCTPRSRGLAARERWSG